MYEYSFDATKSNHNFHPPQQIDDEPFKPMVKYSPPVDDANGFKAIPYEKLDGPQYEQDYYARTSTLNSNQNTAKPFNVQPIVYDTASVPEKQSENSQQPIQNPGPGWISIEKQIVQEIVPHTARISGVPKHRASSGYSRNVNHHHHAAKQFVGYQYNPPPPPPRQNTRYYQIAPDDSFSRQINSIKSQLRPYSLENDTYVNYLPERPPINPDAEFIHPQPIRQDFYQQPPLVNPQHIQRFPIRGSSYQTPISLQRDILVNYRQPLPPINPDSEFIQPQIISRNPSGQYRLSALNIQQQPPPQRLPNEQPGTYYLPSRNFKYVRSNNNN